MISLKIPENLNKISHWFKTAITLTPPTVGRQSADLSADKMPDFSSFFIGRQKINYNYLVIFFSIGRQFWDFGNRPMIGRWSTDNRPISRPMSYLNEPHIIGRCVGRPSADHRPTIGRSSLSTYNRPMCLAPVGRQNDVYRPIKIQKSYRPTVFLNVIAPLGHTTLMYRHLSSTLMSTSGWCRVHPLKLKEIWLFKF